MGSRFYFRFFIFASFLILFGLSWLGSQKTHQGQKRELLKAKLKWEAYSQMELLDRRLNSLDNSIDKIFTAIEPKEALFKSPSSQSRKEDPNEFLIQFPNRPYLLFNQKTASSPIDKNSKSDKASESHKASGNNPDSLHKAVPNPLDSYFDSLFLKIFIFDKRDLGLPLYTKTIEEPELFKALNLKNKQSFLSSGQTRFEKLKWRGKPYLLIFQVRESQIFVAFLKKSYFRLSQTKPSRKNSFPKQSSKRHYKTQDNLKTQALKEPELRSQQLLKQKKTDSKALFSTFDKNQNRFFYNANLKDSSKLITAFLKAPSSKYITRKSKKNQTLYYLQQWKGTNLLFITKKEIPLSFFQAWLEEEINFLLLMGLGLSLLILLLFALYSKLSALFKAYSFLKTALISYSETARFPEDPSKNSLLSFYRNRQEVLNQMMKQDLKPQEKELQLTELIKQEIKKIKSKRPHLVLKEDYQTDLKMFGFQNFFRTIFNELILNAIESMGAMKEQKADISLREENQEIILSVRDYGAGLKEPEKAFQIYYSTKSQLGVGLNLVQSIVTANQGRIELIPQKEGGLLALVRLPLSCFLKK